MQNKIFELKSKIENYKNSALINNRLGIESDDKVLFLNTEEEEIKHAMMDDNIRGGFEYMLASTALAYEHQNRIFIKKSKTCWGRITHKWHNFISVFIPFKEDIKHISFRYDRNVQMYFEIHRFIFLLSIGIFITYLYFLIVHAINADYKNDLLCKYDFPCMLFYSRVLPSEENTFSFTYLTMTFMIFYFSIMKYIAFAKLNQNSKLYDHEHTKFSQFLFTSWDWSIKSKGAYIEKKKRLRNLLKFSIDEVQLNINMKFRTTNEKMKKYFYRFLSFILTLLVLVFHAAFVCIAYVIRGLLISKDKNKITLNISDIFFEIIPPILIAISGIIFPSILRIFVAMEKWDYQSTARKQITIRYYFGRIFGLLCVYFYNIYFVILGNTYSSIFSFLSNLNDFQIIPASTHSCPGIYSINSNSTSNINISVNNTTILNEYTAIPKSLYSECAEDDAVMNILFIFLAEFVIRKIYEVISLLILYLCSYQKRKNGQIYKWPFRTGKRAVDIYILFIQLIAIITYFPYIVPLIPIFLFIEFKFEKFKLMSLRSKPLKFEIEQENGELIMKIFNFSIFLIIVFNTIFYISSIPHNYRIQCFNNSKTGNFMLISKKLCGPYRSFSPVSSTLLAGINSVNILRFIYYIISNPQPLIILLIFVICMVLYGSNNIETFKFYVKQREYVIKFIIFY